MKGEARDGESRIQFGDFTAQVRVVDGKMSVVWLDVDGRPVDLSPPTDTARKRVAPKSITGEVRRLVAGKRESIEALYLRRRPLTYDDWRARFLDDSLNSEMTERLIWRFGGSFISDDPADWGTAAIPRDGRLIGIDGRAIDEPLSTDTVRLWHPIGHSVRDVLSWRAFLEALGVTQPFKQTYREIYLLTDAERATGVYSNRFAAHILERKPFLAVSRGRKWSRMERLEAGLTGIERGIGDWRLRARYHVEDAVDNPNAGYVGSGIVEFVHGGRFVPLEEIPPLVFSEIMRDIDLFVGVASVGNDPNWRGNAHWRSAAFGELSAMAGTRKQVLTDLVPKLHIADRCRIDGRYLYVRGNLMSYKIHLGSSHVLTDPGAQYLCIVPAGSWVAADPSTTTSNAGHIFLPFEGDSTLSSIISKALMLADDDKIRDNIILEQFLRSL